MQYSALSTGQLIFMSVTVVAVLAIWLAGIFIAARPSRRPVAPNVRPHGGNADAVPASARATAANRDAA